MKNIIVGGGRAGKELAAQLSESVIIELEPQKRVELSKLKGVQVIIGDGSDEELLKQAGLEDATALILLTGSDEANYRAAAIAREHGVPRIMVRVEDPEAIARFDELGVEHVMQPTKIVANLVADLIHPDGSGRPFKKLLVPILNSDSVNKAFKEALLISSVAMGEITAVKSGDTDGKELEFLAKDMGVPLTILPEKEESLGIIRKYLRNHACIIIDTVEEHFYSPDCIVIGPEELGFLDRLFGRSVVLQLIRTAYRPVLVARTFRYYNQVLALLDASETAESVGKHSVQMARLCCANMYLLVLEDVPRELIEGIRKLGEKWNVHIIEEWVEGNPMIEAVKAVKSGNYELTVLPWRGTGVIRADLIKKIINDAPCSVLTVV
ncbi:MAG: NAD-binding protein [Euryarchaeota archaeon]|nr:NAD-binding protein [Euryarchaeota archaeon]